MATAGRVEVEGTGSHGVASPRPQYVISRLDTECAFCGDVIPRGQKIYPKSEPVRRDCARWLPF